MYTCSRGERQNPDRQTHEITACEVSAMKETNMGQRDRMTDVNYLREWSGKASSKRDILDQQDKEFVI